MTEPYTAEELQRVATQVESAVREAGGCGSGPDLARLAATLREYERVVAVLSVVEKEREALKELVKTRYSGLTLPAGYNVLDFLSLWHTQEKTARQKAEAEVAALREALQEIAKGEGRFSRDPLTHAENTIANMTALAEKALGPSAPNAARAAGEAPNG